MPLARELPRRGHLQHLGSTLTWSRDATSPDGSGFAQSVADAEFEQTMLDGVTTLPSVAGHGPREFGTLRKEGDALPRGVEDVRRRQEHVEGRLVRAPVLRRTKRQGLGVVRDGVVLELVDLYRMIGSIDVRRFDVGVEDVKALFAWFGLFENFVRVYFWVSEREVYAASGVDDWGGLKGIVGKKRKEEKMGIVRMGEKVGEMKRVMVGGRRVGRFVGELIRRVDGFAMRLLRFLNAEVEEVGRKFEERFEGREKVVWEGLVRSIRKKEGGKEMIVLMGRGVGKGKMLDWIRDMCGGGVGKMNVGNWTRKFMERHANYAILFEKAEMEYREMYKELAEQVDKEIADIRLKFRNTTITTISPS